MAPHQSRERLDPWKPKETFCMPPDYLCRNPTTVHLRQKRLLYSTQTQIVVSSVTDGHFPTRL